MIRLISYPFILAAISLSVSCASYKKQYSKEARDWKTDTVIASDELTHTMYLIGDAGNDMPGAPAPVLNYLKTILPKENKNSSIVFLGDNIYEYGMPPKDDSVKREAAEHRIKAQLQAVDDFKGWPVFLPGNHDWRGWGLKGIRRQEKYIETYLNTHRGKTETRRRSKDRDSIA